MNRNRVDENGLYLGDACYVETSSQGPSGRDGFAVMWQGRNILGIFTSKDVANGIAATFDSLTPRGSAPDQPPVDSLLELVGFRQILADVVGREAKRLEAQELATRTAANRLRGRTWP